MGGMMGGGGEKKPQKKEFEHAGKGGFKAMGRTSGNQSDTGGQIAAAEGKAAAGLAGETRRGKPRK